MTRALVGQFTLSATENPEYAIEGVDLGIVTADTFGSTALRYFNEGYGAALFEIAERTESGGFLVLNIALDWKNGPKRAIITNGLGYCIGIGITIVVKAAGFAIDWPLALAINAISLFATRYSIQPTYDSICNVINGTQFSIYDDGTIDINSKITNSLDMDNLKSLLNGAHNLLNMPYGQIAIDATNASGPIDVKNIANTFKSYATMRISVFSNGGDYIEQFNNDDSILEGGFGNDTIIAAGGTVTLDGGTGYDKYFHYGNIPSDVTTIIDSDGRGEVFFHNYKLANASRIPDEILQNSYGDDIGDVFTLINNTLTIYNPKYKEYLVSEC